MPTREASKHFHQQSLADSATASMDPEATIPVPPDVMVAANGGRSVGVGNQLSVATTQTISPDSWSASKSANWTTKADWSTGAVPTASSSVTIAAAGSYTVTITTSVAAYSVFLNDTGGNLIDESNLTLTSNMTVTAGTFTLTNGTLSGGTLSVGGEGTFEANNGTLSGVTYQGLLSDAGFQGSSLTLSGGTTLTGASGAGSGTISLADANSSLTISNTLVGVATIVETGDNDTLTFFDTRTLKSLSYTLAGYDGTSSTLLIADDTGNGATLTLGSSVLLSQGGTSTAYIEFNDSNDSLINQGMIVAAQGGAQFYLGADSNAGSIGNQGSIDISNAETLFVQTASFTNAGTLSVEGPGSTLNLGTNWTNSGSIIDVDAQLVLGGTFTSANLAGISNSGGSIDIVGLLENSGTLSIGNGTTLGTLDLSGTIGGGVISDAGGGLVWLGGTLTGITYQGLFSDAGNQSSSLTLSGGTTLTGVGGVGTGTISLTGSNSLLTVSGSLVGVGSFIDTGDNSDVLFYDTRELNNASMILAGNDGTESTLEIADDTGNGAKVTLGSQFLLAQGGSSTAYIQLDDTNDELINQGTIAAGQNDALFYLGDSSSNGTIVNQGTVDVSNGETLLVQALKFTNTGTLSVTSGSSFDLSNTVFTDLPGTTLSGGNIFVGAGSILQLAQNAKISVDASSITLSGPGSTIQAYNTSSGHQVAIDASLDAIAAKSTLTLLDGRNFTATADGGTFTDSGTLVLGDTTFTAKSFNLSAGVLSGSGTLASSFNVTGSASIVAGTLDLTGALLGTGTLSVAAGAEFNLSIGGLISGPLNVAGVVALNGSSLGASKITVSAAGTLSGYGTIAGSVSVAGVVAAQGGTLLVGTLSGISGGTLAGIGIGSFAGSALQLTENAGITTDAGTIILSGTASTIDWASSSGTTLVALESSLSSITTAGTLEVLGDRNYTVTAAGGTFALAGALVMGGGVFAASSLVLDAGAKLSGVGTLTAPATISGTTSITSGSLLLAGAISGASTLSIGSAAEVELASSGGFSGLLSDSGTLLLAGANYSAAKVSISATGSVSGFGTLGTVTNAGWLDATGGILTLGALTSLSSGTMTQGQLEADAGSVLQLAANTTLSTLLGSITLSGLGSAIQALNSSTSAEVAVDSTLGSIGKTGALIISNSRTFVASANAGTISDAGLLSIQSGSFSAKDVVVTATGTLLDDGSFSGAIANSGTINIADNIVLGLTSGGALGGSFTGLGTLQLSGATAYTFASTTSLAAGRILVSAGATLKGTGTVTGLLDVAGTLAASSGTLTIDGGFASDDPVTGVLSVAAGAVLDLADGGAFAGIVQGAGSLVNADVISGSTNGASLAGSGTISVANLAGGEIYAGTNDALMISGASNIVNNAGSIGGTRHGVVLSGTSNAVTNSGFITGDIGAAILARGSGTTTIVNSGMIANYEGIGVAAISLNGAASATLTNAGTIIGGYYLTSGQSAVQFGPGNDRLIMDPGSVITGTVRGGLGTNTLEMAALSGAVGTLAGLGTAFQAFSVVTEDAGANWQLVGANALSSGGTLSVGGTLSISGTLAASAVSTISGSGSATVATGGLLEANGATNTTTVSGISLSDQGLVDVSGGATLSLAGANLANLAAGTLTGGGFEVDGASTLLLATGAAVTTDDANIVLAGSGGKIAWLSAAGGTLVSLGQSLTSIGAAGTLNLQGSSFIASAALSDAGQISLAAGTLSATTLTVASTGTVSGTGQIAGSLADQGFVAVSGGTLTLTGSISGAGTLGIGQDSAVVASGTLAGANVTFLSSGGLLDLGLPGAMTGTIQDFATTDTIDLLKTVVTGEKFANDTLTLTGASGTLAVLHFSGDYSGYQFAFIGDGHGGTEILLT